MEQERITLINELIALCQNYELIPTDTKGYYESISDLLGIEEDRQYIDEIVGD